MPQSTITVLPIYLDGRVKTILSGGVSTLEDDSVVIKSDSRTVATTERSDRVMLSWQVSWGKDTNDIVKLFKVCRTSKGFLFISPIDDERVCTAMPCKNTITLGATGDGSTTTFKLQHQISLSYDIGAGSASTDAFDVEYPLSGTVTGYKNGVSASLSDVNLTTGVITFAVAPANGVVVTATYQRAIPVMFTSKTTSRTLLQVDQAEMRSAQIEEIP